MPQVGADRLRTATIVDAVHGSDHLALQVFALDPGGSVSAHVLDAERHVYVLDGAARVRLDGELLEVDEGSYALVPAGVALAWQAGDEGTRWLEARMPALARVVVDVSRQTPSRVRELFDEVRGGASVTGSFAEDSLTASDIPYARGRLAGADVAMLLDAAHGASLGAMFIVEYAPGGEIAVHDHPFEEGYLFLSGQVEARVDGTSVALGAGDALWVGVACSHAFANRSSNPARWLELQAPLPPASNAARFHDDWYLAKAGADAHRAAPAQPKLQAGRSAGLD